MGYMMCVSLTDIAQTEICNRVRCRTRRCGVESAALQFNSEHVDRRWITLNPGVSSDTAWDQGREFSIMDGDVKITRNVEVFVDDTVSKAGDRRPGW